jgi:hypothetical protein
LESQRGGLTAVAPIGANGIIACAWDLSYLREHSVAWKVCAPQVKQGVRLRPTISIVE